MPSNEGNMVRFKQVYKDYATFAFPQLGMTFGRPVEIDVETDKQNYEYFGGGLKVTEIRINDQILRPIE